MLTRWWGIRHVRYVYWGLKVHAWAQWWGSLGLGFGLPHAHDLQHLEDIWHGRA